MQYLDQNFHDLELSQSEKEIIFSHLEGFYDLIKTSSYDGFGYIPSSESTKKTQDIFDEFTSTMNKHPTPEKLKSMLDSAMHELINSPGQRIFSSNALAFIPSNGLPMASVINTIAQLANRFPSHITDCEWVCQIDAIMIKYLCGIFDLGDNSFGCFTSGASHAILTGLLAGRERFKNFDENHIIYLSKQAHFSIYRALRVLGISDSSISYVPCKKDLSIDTDYLIKKIERDVHNNKIPSIVISSCGTTNTGVIDDNMALSKIKNRFNLFWLVDGAYGALFKLVESLQHKFEGIEDSDAIVLDLHKGLSFPFGTGVLLVKNKDILRNALRFDSEYINFLDVEVPSSFDYSIELTKPFRSLSLWFCIGYYGINTFKSNLKEKIDLTIYLFDELSKNGHLKLYAKPDLTIIAIRHVEGDSKTESLLKNLLSTRKFYLHSTSIDGYLYIRIAILGFRTHFEQIKDLCFLINKETANF